MDKLIESGCQLSQEEQLKLLGTKDAELIEKYMEDNFFCGSAQLMLLSDMSLFPLLKKYLETHYLDILPQKVMVEHPQAEELLEIYLQNFYLSYRGQKQLFRQPNAEELIGIYIKYRFFCTTLEVKLMYSDMPNIVRKYVATYNLCDSAQIAFLKRPDVVELFDDLLSNEAGPLSLEAEMFMLSLPCAETLIKKYVQHFPLYEEVEAAMFERPNAYQLFREYTKVYPLLDENEHKIFSLPNAKKVLLWYEKEFGLTEMNKALLEKLA